MLSTLAPRKLFQGARHGRKHLDLVDQLHGKLVLASKRILSIPAGVGGGKPDMGALDSHSPTKGSSTASKELADFFFSMKARIKRHQTRILYVHIYMYIWLHVIRLYHRKLLIKLACLFYHTGSVFTQPAVRCLEDFRSGNWMKS